MGVSLTAIHSFTFFTFISNPAEAGARAGAGFGKKLFWNHRTPDETNGVDIAVSCYDETVQFSASFVTSLFASF